MMIKYRNGVQIIGMSVFKKRIPVQNKYDSTCKSIAPLVRVLKGCLLQINHDSYGLMINSD